MMADELKTLKDLTGRIRDTTIDVALIGDLKKEAIKEIKYAGSSKDETKGLFSGGINFMFTKDVVNYIKWKNNLTEEDLK